VAYPAAVGDTVRITCPACACSEIWPGAWGSLDGTPGIMNLEAALIVREGWGLGEKAACPGCACHTGEGILPQLLFTVE
jgi:hypothetical protein